eukprot:scaffold637_cov322-Prasinococcus_capsulatus_cf.AAC.4
MLPGFRLDPQRHQPLRGSWLPSDAALFLPAPAIQLRWKVCRPSIASAPRGSRWQLTLTAASSVPKAGGSARSSSRFSRAKNAASAAEAAAAVAEEMPAWVWAFVAVSA